MEKRKIEILYFPVHCAYCNSAMNELEHKHTTKRNGIIEPVCELCYDKFEDTIII